MFRTDRTRLRIVQAARRLFSERSYGKVHMTDISKEAGVSKVTVYRYFANETLYEEATGRSSTGKSSRAFGEFVDVGLVPYWLLIDAVRYALGRTSTQPSTTCAWLVAHWPQLPQGVREIIMRDIEDEFRRDDAARVRGETTGLPLGHNCDRQAWDSVRGLWHKENSHASR